MIEPMLASLLDAPLNDPQLVYEPKYDGIRAIAEVRPDHVRLWSRLGNEKTRQFPEVADALLAWAREYSRGSRRTHNIDVVLDGEIVALDSHGAPTGFQHLQGRIHMTDGGDSSHDAGKSPSTAFIAFDLIKEGAQDWRGKPLTARRDALERVFTGATKSSPVLRLSRQVRGDGRALFEEALSQGWEGLIAKHAASLYKSGKRTPDWRKLKIVHEQEFVIGGWTEPRQTRTYFGALLLGVYDQPADKAATGSSKKHGHAAPLVYIGHIGTGFNEQELSRVMKRLKQLEIDTSPFAERIKTNETPHWVKPELVAQVKFTEWTTDGKLRHPVYLGLRDDKKPTDVHREVQGRGHAAAPSPTRAKANTANAKMSSSRPRKTTSRVDDPPAVTLDADVAGIIEQLNVLEDAKRDGLLELPGGDTVAVTNLHKVFWPKARLTKGDLLRYYVRVSPAILPVIADRPLVMKRFPNGVTAKPFYQHQVPDAPAGVRAEHIAGDDERAAESRVQIIGGSLKTLLYTTQLASISQDPWFSRLPHPQYVDHIALDLDPADGLPFERCLDIAHWIRDELGALSATGWPKTSGADGLHVFVPMPARTPYRTALIFAEILATIVAHKHPKAATIERKVAARGKRVYVDYLQNIQGKTLASAYSVRATPNAGVSTPLSWKEVDDGVEREDFTMTTVPDRLARVGDLWASLLQSPGVDLARITRQAQEEEGQEEES